MERGQGGKGEGYLVMQGLLGLVKTSGFAGEKVFLE